MKSRPFACEKEGCGATFSLKHHLTRHEKLHSNPKPFICSWPGCTESFAKHDQLRCHVCLVHTGEAVYQCTKCESGFQSKAELKRHEKSTHGSREYVCGLEGCGATFPKWTLVVSHRRQSHNHPKDQLNLKCEECGRGPFKTEASLRQHCKIHDTSVSKASKQHVCPHCEKEFVSRSNLKSHILAVHSATLPFVCDQCGKSYGYKKLLIRHIEKRHSNSAAAAVVVEEEQAPIDASSNLFFGKERNLKCPVRECQRRFFRQYDLDRHLQSHE